MRKAMLIGVAAAFALVLTLAGSAFSASAQGPRGPKDAKPHKHDFETALSVRQRGLKEKALQMKLAGKVPNDAKVVQVAKGQYVELAREDTDRIFVVLAEFGETRHPLIPDRPDVSQAVLFAGPEHNEIPAPDRAQDNTTIWKPDFSTDHYDDMYFDRMREYYERQSSGRYSIEGDVIEWVKVPFNQARYGTDDCNVDGTIDYAGGSDSIVCPTVWSLVRDAMAFWVDEQIASGRTMQEIQDYLKTFDVWDRYDFNFNGNFDEPDGVIDHFQIVHSGGDQAAGRQTPLGTVCAISACDPEYGTDAIWSHRWATQLHPGGPYTVFDPNLLMLEVGRGGPSGGLTIPSNPTGMWVFDYTIQPENGGLGVFAHEYGHDLNLPDLYDTSGNTCPIPDGFCENSTGFWTLMSSGANIGDGDGPPTGVNGIGDAPTNLGAYEKLQLGWLNFEVAFAGQKSEHKLGPAGFNTRQAQAVIVVLPPRERDVEIYEPLPGGSLFAQWSTSGNNLDRSISKPVSGGGLLTADVNFEAEFRFDYAFLEASSNNGTTWTPILTNLSSAEDDLGSGFNTSHTGMTGDSGGWVTLNATLPPGTTNIRFRYRTDPAVVENGFIFDNVSVAGGAPDTFESGDDGWTSAGFVRTGPINSVSEPQFYFLENRNYQADDLSLKTAYNFGHRNTPPGAATGPDWVEYFPYQDGMLVTYWDTFWGEDNNTTSHPGEGAILPVDAHPNVLIRGDGAPWRARVQSYDSTFGLDPTDAITLHLNSVGTTHPSQPAVPVFDDSQSYWSPLTPFAGVKVPNTGTTVRVKSVSAQGAMMQIEVAPKK